MTDQICPTCKGRKRTESLVTVECDCGRRSEWRMLDCSTCKGTGTIDARHAALSEEAEAVAREKGRLE